MPSDTGKAELIRQLRLIRDDEARTPYGGWLTAGLEWIEELAAALRVMVALNELYVCQIRRNDSARTALGPLANPEPDNPKED